MNAPIRSSAIPVLYFDLGSPYAYLAAERAEDVLGVEVRFQPVLLGAIFANRGWGSWSQTPEREKNIAEIEQRARIYGLPDVQWPPGWPADTLKAMRATVWAGELGAGKAFARAAFRAAFVHGRDLGEVDVIAEVGESVGLRAKDLEAALLNERIKDDLKTATAAAIAEGVSGVPSLRVGELVFYGDDQLVEVTGVLEGS